MKDDTRTPLRSVLINFLNHIKLLESDEYPEISYESEFQDLKSFSESVKGLKQYSCYEGEKDLNRKKNRYKDILPFDLSRVILEEYAGVTGSDYINANYIKGASGSIAYIASQGPLSNTVIDFWRMVVQCEVQVIVMACNEKEAGKAKCEKYWVEDGEERQFGSVSVKLLKASTVCPDFSVRTMRLKYPTKNASVIEERTVCQLHYVAWPDHGVPSVVHPLLEMVKLVRDTQASETLPVLVHCSAGCGRTGTICAIDYVWGLLRTGKLTKNFSLLELVREMRRQRISMVQTKEQYILVHQAVRELFQEQLNMIDSHPYENVDINGIIKGEEDSIYEVVEAHAQKSSEGGQVEKERSMPSSASVTISKLDSETDSLYSARTPFTPRETSQSSAAKVDKLKCQFESSPDPSQESEAGRSQDEPVSKRSHLRRATQIDIQPPKTSNTLVKRSKSLKLLSRESSSFMGTGETSSKSKPRSQADSKLTEKAPDPAKASQRISNNPKDSKHVFQIVKDYEAMNAVGIRKPLVRSYTTLDMNQKPSIQSRANLNISLPAEGNAIPKHCKITRSHTHLDLKKIFNKTPDKQSKNVSRNLFNLNPQKKRDKDQSGNSNANLSTPVSSKLPSALTPPSKSVGRPNSYHQSIPFNNNPLYFSTPKANPKALPRKSFIGNYSTKNSKDIGLKQTEPNGFPTYPTSKEHLARKSDLFDRSHLKNYTREIAQLSQQSEIISQSVNVEWGKKPFINSLRSQVKLSTSDGGAEPIYINTAVKLQPKSGIKELSPENSEKALELDVTISSLNLSSKSMRISSDYSFVKPGYKSSIESSPGFNIAEKVFYRQNKPRKVEDAKNSERDGILNNLASPDYSKNSSESCNSLMDQLSSDDSFIQKIAQREGFITSENDLEEKRGLFMNGNHNLLEDSSKIRSDELLKTNDTKKYKSVILNRNAKEENRLKNWPAGNSYNKMPMKNNWNGKSQPLSKEQLWESAPGVDLDQVAASMSHKEEGKNKLLKTALEALHIRRSKGTPSSSPATKQPDVNKSTRKHQYL